MIDDYNIGISPTEPYLQVSTADNAPSKEAQEFWAILISSQRQLFSTNFSLPAGSTAVMVAIPTEFIGCTRLFFGKGVSTFISHDPQDAGEVEVNNATKH